MHARHVTSRVGPPLSFFENWKKIPVSGNNPLIVSIYGLHFSFEMLFAVSKIKKKHFSCRAFFCVVDELFIMVTLFQETFPTMKKS